MRGIRLLSNLLWTAPLAAFWWWVVSVSWDGIAHGDDRGGAAVTSVVISALLTAALAFCAREAVKAARDFDPTRPHTSTLGNIVVQLILLAMLAVSLPPFFDLVAYSNEGARKADLNHLRGTLDSYSAKKGRPARLEALVEERLLETLPRLRYPRGPHETTRETVNLAPGVFTDSGRWGYSVEASTPIFVDCTHTDHRGGIAWNNY